MQRRDFVKLGVAAAIPATLGTSAIPAAVGAECCTLVGDQELIAEKTKLIDFILDNMFEPCDSALVDKLQAAFPGQQVSIDTSSGEMVATKFHGVLNSWIFKVDNTMATLTYDTDVNVVN